MRQCIFFVVLIVSTVFCQDGIWISNLIIRPNPSPFIEDWEDDPNIAEFSLTHTGASEEIRVKFKTEITESDHGLVLSSMSNFHTIPPNEMQSFRNNGFILWKDVEYSRDFERFIERAGTIPEGDYEICIKVVDRDAIEVYHEVCRDFEIVYPDPPSLVLPLDEDSLTLDFPTFTWTPITAIAEVNYVLKITELLEGQSKVEAMRGNPIILEKDMGNFLSYTYAISDPELEIGKSYVWSVRSETIEGTPFGKNKGMSEIWSFSKKSLFEDDTLPSESEYEDEIDDEIDDGIIDTVGDGEVRLAGVLLDYFTNEPIEGAIVIYHKATMLDTTASTGRFIYDPFEDGFTPSGFIDLGYVPEGTFDMNATGMLGDISPSESGSISEQIAFNSGLSISFRPPLPPFELSEDSLVAITNSNGEFAFIGTFDSSHYSIKVIKEEYLKTQFVDLEHSFASQYFQEGDIDGKEFFLHPTHSILRGTVITDYRDQPLTNAIITVEKRIKTEFITSISSAVINNSSTPAFSSGRPEISGSSSGSLGAIGIAPVGTASSGISIGGISSAISSGISTEIDIPSLTPELSVFSDVSYFHQIITTDSDGKFTMNNLSAMYQYKIKIQHRMIREYESEWLDPVTGEYLDQTFNVELKRGKISGVVHCHMLDGEINPLGGAKVIITRDPFVGFAGFRDLDGSSSTSSPVIGNSTADFSFTGISSDYAELDTLFDGNVILENPPAIENSFTETNWLGEFGEISLETLIESGYHLLYAPPEEEWVVDDVKTEGGSGTFTIDDIPINDPDNVHSTYRIWIEKLGGERSSETIWQRFRLAFDGDSAYLELETRQLPSLITGQVTEEGTGMPLPFVRVELQNRDLTGEFEIDLLRDRDLYPASSEIEVESSPTITNTGLPGLTIFDSNTGSIDIGTSDLSNLPLSITGPLSFVDSYNYSTLRFALTDAQGRYCIFNVEPGEYDRIHFSKQGYQPASTYSVEIDSSDFEIANEQLSNRFGYVKGFVFDEDSLPVGGAEFKPMVYGFVANSVSNFDGSYEVGVPPERCALKIEGPGLVDQLHEVNVEYGDTIYMDFYLETYKGHAKVEVLDAETSEPIEGARVFIGEYRNGTTSSDGIAFIPNVRIEPPQQDHPITVYGPIGTDYMRLSSMISITYDDTAQATVEIEMGASVSGKVKSERNELLPNAIVEIDGYDYVKDTTDASGNYHLHGIPPGDIVKVKTSYIEYVSDDSVVTLVEGESKTGVDLILENSPFSSVFGFPTYVDSIKTTPSGKKIWGAIAEIPDCENIKIKNPNQKLYFSNIDLNDSYEPLVNEVPLDIPSFDIELLGFDAKINGPPKIRYSPSEGIGYITGDIELDLESTIGSIGGTNWANVIIEEKSGLGDLPNLTSSGVSVGPSSLPVTPASLTGYSLWGFGLEVNNNITLNEDGLHYSGSLQIPGFSGISIDNISISNEMQITNIVIDSEPPIHVEAGPFSIFMDGITFSAAGLRTDGRVHVDVINKTFNFDNLRITYQGNLSSINFDVSSLSSFDFIGQEFDIDYACLGTDGSGKKYFVFSGDMELPMIDHDIGFDLLRIDQDFNLTGTIEPNIHASFGGVFSIHIAEIELFDDKVSLFSEFEIDVPGLYLNVANITFFENGDFEVEEVNFDFEAGPVEVGVNISWQDNVLQGSGYIRVEPYFSLDAWFRYGSTDDWWIKIRVGATIPIGPITIDEITGELGYYYGHWTFGFGCRASVFDLNDVIALEAYLLIESGPIIHGDAAVEVLNTYEIGSASLIIDYPDEYFYGGIQMGFDTYGLDISATIEMGIKGGDYWFVHGGIYVYVWSMTELGCDLYIGSNYQGDPHNFHVPGHGDSPEHLVSEINGFHFDGLVGRRLDADLGIGGFDMGYDFKFSITLDPVADNYSGGFRARAWIHGRIGWEGFGIGVGAEGVLEAYFGYQGCLGLHAHASIEGYGYIGCCDPGPCGGWGDLCWWAFVPCGGKICPNFSVTIDYNYSGGHDCGDGWDFDLDW